MADSSLSVETRAETTPGSQIIDPFRNPTYPSRSHLFERPALEKALRSCEDRLTAALQKLNVLANHPRKPHFVRLFHQMQGARDQVAEAVRRLPLEVGGLYREDHERFEQAMQSIDRTWRRWEKSSG